MHSSLFRRFEFTEEEKSQHREYERQRRAQAAAEVYAGVAAVWNGDVEACILEGHEARHVAHRADVVPKIDSTNVDQVAAWAVQTYPPRQFWGQIVSAAAGMKQPGRLFDQVSDTIDPTTS